MDTLVLAQQKGGTGKSTTAYYVAVEAAHAGLRVAVIDLDPQQTLAGRWAKRSAETPVLIQVPEPASERLPDTLAQIARHFDLCVIDTPGQVANPAIPATISCADLVLLPVRPGEIDVEAAAKTLAIAEEHGKPFALLPNAIRPTKLSSQTVDMLSEFGSVSPARLGLRDLYAAAWTDGRAPREVEPGGAAAQEIEALWLWIAKRMDHNRRVAAAAARKRSKATA